MISSKVVCNLCGRDFDVWDKQEDFSIHKRCGYGTKYDGETLNLDICCDCMEQLIDSCEVSPIEDEGKTLICDRCGNHFRASEHFDFITCSGTTRFLCPDCAEFLSEHEEEFNDYIQRIKTVEERRLHRNKHE